MAAHWAGVGSGERADGWSDTVMGAQVVGPTSTSKTTPGCMLEMKTKNVSISLGGMTLGIRRHDTKHYDIQLIDIQHK